MNKKYIIKKNEEIQKIIKNSKKIVNKYFIIYLVNNNLKYNRYCVSVSKKIGKANIRNLYKRRIKDILMKNNFNSSNDYVIILRKPILDISYQEINNEIIKCLKGEN
ncbi:MAG: ribonuclease P protein component [bacterium]|nr:ribonuclease P protein component [bacterium]